MVSSENPLSNSSRYYVNDYEAKRSQPSVANNQRNYGEEKKEHYQRSGTESKNNPLAHTNNYYQNYTGKKVEEYVE
jgi:hypothetical protein